MILLSIQEASTMKLKDSELILIDGRIYHLGLAPEDIADIIITVGDPNRVERVSRHFDKIEYRGQKREFLTHTGFLGKKRITVIGTGIGPDNIDILLNEIDALKNINFKSREINKKKRSVNIIRLGTSGALQEDIKVDSMIVSSHGFGLDGLLNFYDYDLTHFQEEFMSKLKNFVPALFNICYPTLFKGSDTLAKDIANDLRSGITLTAGGFYAPQGRELRLKQKMRSIIDKMVKFEFDGMHFSNFEMETSSIYGLSHLLGHRALSVNAIIANRATGEFSKDPRKTIDSMIVNILDRIAGSDLV